MKKCSKCGEEKQLSEFHRTARSKDGRVHNCKKCACDYTNARYRGSVEVRERKRAGDRERYYSNPKKRNMQKTLLYHTSEDYRRKKKIRSRVQEAVKRGRLTKEPCEVCGEEKVQAHHDDYDKPLEVRWLCQSCHSKHHLEAGDLIKSRRSKGVNKPLFADSH